MQYKAYVGSFTIYLDKEKGLLFRKQYLSIVESLRYGTASFQDINHSILDEFFKMKYLNEI
jgi:hypothetical protein